MLPSYNLHHLYADLGSSSSLARVLIREATSTSISLLSDLCLDFNHPQEPYWRTIHHILFVLELFSRDERCTFPQSHLTSHWRQRVTALHAVSYPHSVRSIFLDGTFRSQTILLRADTYPSMRNPIKQSHCRLQFHTEPSLRLKIARKLLRCVTTRRIAA